MSGNSRDMSILRHILSYCGQIKEAEARFGADKALFATDNIYHNAVSLCILQIGELVGNLTDEFRAAHPSIPWREIKLMRNIVAHRYGTVDHSLTWDVMIKDIPELERFCHEILNEWERETKMEESET
ncbi:MAG: DUF86 domain-containing protein [Oscillospiraceae bacterium]|nr:DUF86 domain-containing protein [Oscillospiraceae bacterium]